MLLDRINSPFIRANASVLQALMRLIPFLAFGDQEKMHALVSHFMPYLDFDKCVLVVILPFYYHYSLPSFCSIAYASVNAIKKFNTLTALLIIHKMVFRVLFFVKNLFTFSQW